MVSTVSMIQPVYAYEVGIPDEAIDVVQEAEIKIYDEDEWEKAVGKKGSDPGDIYSGDADVVGARQMVIIRDIGQEGDDAEGPGDNDLGEKLPVVEKFAQAIKPSLAEMDYGITTAFTGIMAVVNGSIANVGGDTSLTHMSTGMLSQGIEDWDDLMALYGGKYESGIMWRDKWYFNEDWESDSDYGDLDKVDLDAEDKWDGWGPILADPRDRRDVIDNLGAMKRHFRGQIMALRTQVYNTYLQFFDTTTVVPGGTGPPNRPYFVPWEFKAGMDIVYNNTNSALAMAALGAPLVDILAGMGLTGNIARINWTDANGPDLNITGHEDYLFTLFQALEGGLAAMYYNTDAMPYDQKAEIFLAFTAAGNLPIQVPAGDYVARMMKEMNFDEDAETLYRMPWVSTTIDYNNDGTLNGIEKGSENLYNVSLGGEKVYVYAYLDFDLEGQVLTVEVEYQDGQIDPADMVVAGYKGEGEDELKDFEFVITFSDPGGCGCAWTRGDTIMWQSGAVDQIPGYEMTILLGASAISVLALVYIIMKKRRK